MITESKSKPLTTLISESSLGIVKYQSILPLQVLDLPVLEYYVRCNVTRRSKPSWCPKGKGHQYDSPTRVPTKNNIIKYARGSDPVSFSYVPDLSP